MQADPAGAYSMRAGLPRRDRMLAHPDVKPMKMGGRTMTGFFRVAPAGFKTAASLRRWIKGGIAAGAASKRKRPRR